MGGAGGQGSLVQNYPILISPHPLQISQRPPSSQPHPPSTQPLPLRILMSLVEPGSLWMPWMMGKENFPSVRSSQKLLFSVYCQRTKDKGHRSIDFGSPGSTITFDCHLIQRDAPNIDFGIYYKGNPHIHFTNGREA